MYETLKDLHRKFYTRAVMPELKCDYDDAFQQLMSRLAKSERKLALKAVDTKGLMMEACRIGQLCLRIPAGTWPDNRITALRGRTVRGSSGRSLRNGGGTK